jgi:hypothetical protein
MGYPVELLIAVQRQLTKPLTFGSAAFLIAERSYFTPQMLGEFLDPFELVDETLRQEATIQGFDIWLQGLGESEKFFGLTLQRGRINR